MNSTEDPMVPMRRAFSGDLLELALTIQMPPIEHSRPSDASASGRDIIADCPPMASVVPIAMVDAIAIEAIIAPQ